MVVPFIHKYLIKDFYALNVHMDENVQIFHILHIRKKQHTLKIIDQDSTCEFEKVITTLKKNIPIVISFTGKNIISKKISNQTNYLDTILFNQAPDNFYIHETFKETQILVSFARKETIDTYLEKLNRAKLSILSFSIGYYILENLIPLLPSKNKVVTKQYSYDFLTSTVNDDHEDKLLENKDLHIADEQIENDKILAFSGFIAYLNATDVTINYEVQSQQYRQDFAYRKAFLTIGPGMLVIFLILLSLSYGLTSIYHSKSANIQQEITVNNQLLDQIETFKKDKNYKESIIANSSLGTKHFLSLYIFQIGESIPDAITLERLQVFPTKNPVSPDSKIETMSNKIIISGVTSSEYSVNDWIALLDETPWIIKTEITSYIRTKNEYEFSLNLFL